MNRDEELLVSVITVVFNGEDYLQQTIDSVKNQTYKNIEYIIIDGGSTDNTINIIKKNQDHISHWISEPDKGLYDAMNKGVKIANGDLIGTINSDDWYELDAIRLVVDTYLKNPNAKVIHSNRYDVYSDNTRKVYAYNPSVFKLKYLSMTFSHPSMFVTREVYQQYSYNIALKSYADYQFSLMVFMNNNKFVHIDKPLVNFRVGGISGQLSLREELQQGFIARNNAGLNVFENIFALFLRILTKTFLTHKKK
jgi:glycosyltransferase involved in cell wall biosynthesis